MNRGQRAGRHLLRWRHPACVLLATGVFTTTTSASEPSCAAHRPLALVEADGNDSGGCPLSRDLARSNQSLISGTVPTSSDHSSTPPSAGEALRQAKDALAKGHLDQALQHCQEAIRSDPKSALAHFLLGMIQIRRRNEREALEALLRSLELDPAHGATHYYLGKLYLARNEYPAAIHEFEAAVKLGDPSGSGQYGLGLALFAQSRYAEARAHLMTAVEANPRDSERLFTLVGDELQLKHVGAARRELVHLRQRFPNDAPLAYRTGKMLLEYNLPHEAEGELRRASGLLSNSSDNPPAAGLSVSDLYLQLARLQFDRHDYMGALRDFDKIALPSVAPNLQASALHLQGQALVGVGRAREAVEKLRQAVRLNPGNPEYFVHLTWAELSAGDTSAAAHTAELAAAKWPNVQDVRLMLTLLRREKTPGWSRVPPSQEWHVKGDGLVCCPCAVPCPCRSNAMPTYRHCENTGVIYIREGHYGNISLDGLIFAAVNRSMETQETPDELYLASSTTDTQLIALERLMQSFSPLEPSIILTAERTPISFVASREGDSYEVRIPKVLEMRIRRELDRRGKPLFPAAALDQFSNTIEYARNLIYKLWDKNGTMKWDFSGRQANFRKIDLDSRAYIDQTMLIQFADGSGTFNRNQLELIKSQNLPLPPKRADHDHPNPHAER
jgi:tetratricopeptide (TPR) repeat protein